MSDNVEMAVGIDSGKVILKYKAPVDTVVFDPPNVEAVARALMDAAFEADTDLKPAGDTVKANFVEKHRRVLRRRLAVILNSQREMKTVSNSSLAIELVEVCLREIFS